MCCCPRLSGFTYSIGEAVGQRGIVVGAAECVSDELGPVLEQTLVDSFTRSR